VEFLKLFLWRAVYSASHLYLACLARSASICAKWKKYST
jgi:hypothetical protein